MSSVLQRSLPPSLAGLSIHRWSEVTIGKSAAAVWRIEAPGETLFLKSAPSHGPNELPDEVARLRWLSAAAVPAPTVMEFIAADGVDWLLMSAVAGADLTSLKQDPAQLCAVMAAALRRLHAVDPATCPFDHRIERKLELGERNVAAGWVDEGDFDEHVGWSAEAVLNWVGSNRPAEIHLVVAHGDACLPNIMAYGGEFSGMVDCGRLGVADPWQDLAIACRSIAANCGRDCVEQFLAAYGTPWDGERFRFYNALDQLF